MSKALQKKILRGEAKIAVIGLGYVGLPLAMSFAEKGFQVYGIDNDGDRVRRLQRKKSYITDISNKKIARVVGRGQLIPTTNFRHVKECQAVIICVPTPIKRKYTPDISFMLSAVRSVAENISANTLVVLESTTYPGTTEELIKPELEKSGFKVGRNLYLAFSPERIDPGNKTYQVTGIPKVVGGMTETCSELTRILYHQIIKKIHVVSSPRAAEMTKLLENTFRIVNIGWINEAAMMCQAFGIDIWEVIDAAKTKPFGFMPFYPGLGVGGHCIPEDPIYLYWKAKQKGHHSRFIKLAADINSAMPEYVVKRLEGIFKSRGWKLPGARVLVLGVTYKKDVKDLRKSPSLKLIEALRHHKVRVDFHDPLVPYLNINGLKTDGIALKPKAIAAYDCVIMAVDHTHVDYQMVLENARVIFDAKNVYQDARSHKVVKL